MWVWTAIALIILMSVDLAGLIPIFISFLLLRLQCDLP